MARTPDTIQPKNPDTGANLETLRRLAQTEFGISPKEARAVASEALEYFSKSGELERLNIMLDYLKKASKLTKDVKGIGGKMSLLIKAYGEEAVDNNLQNFCDALSIALESGDLTKEVDEDEDVLGIITEKAVKSSINVINTTHLAEKTDTSEGGSIARKEGKFERDYKKTATDLLTAAQDFEKKYPVIVIRAAAMLKNKDTLNALTLLDNPTTEENESTEAPAQMEAKTRTTEKPLSTMINLVIALERLDILNNKRGDKMNINVSLQRNGGPKLSDNMNLILSTKLDGTTTRDTSTPTEREKIEKEKKFYKDQVALFDKIQEVLAARDEAIKATNALKSNQLDKDLESIKASVNAKLQADDASELGIGENALNAGVQNDIERQITAIQAELPALKTAVEKRLKAVRSPLPDVLGGLRGAVHNTRQTALLALGIAMLGGGGVLAVKNAGPSEAELAAATSQAKTEGHIAGVEEGRKAGQQAAINELATVLGFKFEGNITKEQIVNGLNQEDPEATLEDAKTDLDNLIFYLVSTKGYADASTAFRIANIESIESINDVERLKQAKEAILKNLVDRAMEGDNSAGARTLLAGINKLPDAVKTFISDQLSDNNQNKAAEQIR